MRRFITDIEEEHTWVIGGKSRRKEMSRKPKM
jgi:hypothetical protein